MNKYIVRMRGDRFILKVNKNYFWKNPDKCTKELDAIARKNGFPITQYMRTKLEDYDGNNIAFEYVHEADFR